jgi:hypothetical protein
MKLYATFETILQLYATILQQFCLQLYATMQLIMFFSDYMQLYSTMKLYATMQLYETICKYATYPTI